MNTVMSRKKLFAEIAFLVCGIFILNFAASRFYWYSSIFWFDMLMHFLGGLWLGLVFIWLYRTRAMETVSFLKIMASVFVIGFLWEIYEIIVNSSFAQNPFDIYDTVSDLFFDSAGGATAILYVFRRSSRN